MQSEQQVLPNKKLQDNRPSSLREGGRSRPNFEPLCGQGHLEPNA
jgi:hypothetical protein